MSKKRPTSYERALKHQLAEAIDTARNAASATLLARREREEMRIERNHYEKTALQMTEERDFAHKQMQEAAKAQSGFIAAIKSRDQQIRRLFDSVFGLHIDLARKEGYIERVHATDRPDFPFAPAAEDVPDPGMIRERLADAPSERRVADILDGIDTDTLDQVLGRDGDQGYERTPL